MSNRSNLARLAAASLGCLAAACGILDHDGGARPIAAELGEPFVLRPGESAVVAPAGLRVTFEDVLDESRCPADVECVRAGNARIAVRLARPGETRVIELNTTEGARVVGFAGYDVALLALEPRPRSDRPRPEPSAYTATLEVTDGT